MSLRTMKQFLIASGLVALGVASTGCGDNDNNSNGDGDDDMDGGAKDAGPMVDAKADAKVTADATVAAPITCGELSCTGTKIVMTEVAACCTPQNTCGLDAEDIKKANSASTFTGCVPKDAFPDAVASTYCGAFFDLVEPSGNHTNNGLDLASSAGDLVFTGCCLPTGECGANLTTPLDGEGKPISVINIHLGCVGFNELAAALSSGTDAGPAPTPAKLPFCNPTTGAEVTEGTVHGAPTFVCGCGVGNVDPKVPGSFPCLNNLPAAVCGADAPTDAQLAGIPEFVCGAVGGTPNGLPTLPNTASTICGTKEITTGSAELAAVPEFVCGAVGATPNGLPMLAGVESTVCGAKPITADSAELAGVPEFVCGLEGNTDTSAVPKLRNVEVAICGKKEITTGSAELAQFPVFICGAQGNPDPNFPKLANVPGTVCGTQAVTTGAASIAAVPEFLCGCTGRIDAKLGCMRNVANDVCGGAAVDATFARLPLIPKFICGCGPTTIDNEAGKFCLSNVETTVCGTRGDLVTDQGAVGPSLEDCLTGVPKYAGGCGATEPTAGQSCLRQTPQAYGCDVPANPVPRVPEYVCGCGVTNTTAAGQATNGILPCLALTVETTCGVLPITGRAQLSPALPNVICGCGEDVTTTVAACLDHVPGSICGPGPVCTTIGGVGAAGGCADGLTCKDKKGGTGSGAGGVGGAGDGIGDICE